MMPKSRLMRIILVAASALILVGVSLLGWMLATEQERNVISVQMDSDKTQVVTFEGLALVPGDACEYIILLEDGHTQTYQLNLNFVELEEKTLKHYARVSIVSGDDVVYDELLKTAFESESIVLDVDCKEDENTQLKVVYYLPLEVGNEAKLAEAIFELQITASNE